VSAGAFSRSRSFSRKLSLSVTLQISHPFPLALSLLIPELLGIGWAREVVVEARVLTNVSALLRDSGGVGIVGHSHTASGGCTSADRRAVAIHESVDVIGAAVAAAAELAVAVTAEVATADVVAAPTAMAALSCSAAGVAT
jgi:hypothetical protein